MSMSLQDQYAEATAPALQGRVQMATAKIAEDVGSEDPATPNHANRTSLATQVARSPGAFTQSFTTAVVAQGITSQSTDADISNAVSAVWNTMAGPTVPTAVAPAMGA